VTALSNQRDIDPGRVVVKNAATGTLRRVHIDFLVCEHWRGQWVSDAAAKAFEVAAEPNSGDQP
jgi:hypothetical protein